MGLSKIVLDVLKPHEPSLIEFCRELVKERGLEKINVVAVEMDAQTGSLKMTVEGTDINYSKLEEVIKKLGAAIHSIDEVIIEKIARHSSKQTAHEASSETHART